MTDPFAVTNAQFNALKAIERRWKITPDDMKLDELNVVDFDKVKPGSYIGVCTTHGRNFDECKCFRGDVMPTGKRGMFLGIETDGYTHS